MLSFDRYLPPFTLLILGLIAGVVFGDDSVLGVVGGGLFVWGFFWVLKIWSEEGEAVRLLRQRDREDRVRRMTEEMDRR